MSAPPLVSVVMPLWQPHARHLREAVESLLAQTMSDWELVVVEDPSAASAAEVLSSFNDPRIVHIVNRERTGLAAQRARCMEAARCDLIALLDGDDVCEPERLAIQMQYLAAHPHVAAVGSQLTIIDPDSQPFAMRDYPLESTAVAAAMRTYNALAQPSVMVRRAAVLAVGNYRDDFPACEDYDLWCRLVVGGYAIANVPQRLLRYRRHAAQMKSRRLQQTLRDTIGIKRRYFGAQLTLRERWQCRLEGVLMWLPTGVVLSLFQRMRYVRRHPILRV